MEEDIKESGGKLTAMVDVICKSVKVTAGKVCDTGKGSH